MSSKLYYIMMTAEISSTCVSFGVRSLHCSPLILLSAEVFELSLLLFLWKADFMSIENKISVHIQFIPKAELQQKYTIPLRNFYASVTTIKSKKIWVTVLEMGNARQLLPGFASNSCGGWTKKWKLLYNFPSEQRENNRGRWEFVPEHSTYSSETKVEVRPTQDSQDGIPSFKMHQIAQSILPMLMIKKHSKYVHL